MAIKHKLLKQMKRLKNTEKILEAAQKATDLEFKIQEAWGFTKDSKFHRFWEMPHCSCPKLDNADSWPTGIYTYNLDCKIHGCFV
jgi:hypothetical protein